VDGKPLNIAKVYQWNGVDPQTGLYTFEDFNGDGAIASPDDLQLVKELDPAYYGGVTSNLSIGKFTMDLLLQFSRQEGYNFWATGGVLVGRLSNQPRLVLQRWQEAGDMAPVQRFSTGTSQTTQAFRQYGRSDAAISDASFLRLRTLSFSYRLT